MKFDGRPSWLPARHRVLDETPTRRSRRVAPTSLSLVGENLTRPARKPRRHSQSAASSADRGHTSTGKLIGWPLSTIPSSRRIG